MTQNRVEEWTMHLGRQVKVIQLRNWSSRRLDCSLEVTELGSWGALTETQIWLSKSFILSTLSFPLMTFNIFGDKECNYICNVFSNHHRFCVSPQKLIGSLTISYYVYLDSSICLIKYQQKRIIQKAVIYITLTIFHTKRRWVFYRYK